MHAPWGGTPTHDARTTTHPCRAHACRAHPCRAHACGGAGGLCGRAAECGRGRAQLARLGWPAPHLAQAPCTLPLTFTLTLTLTLTLFLSLTLSLTFSLTLTPSLTLTLTLTPSLGLACRPVERATV